MGSFWQHFGTIFDRFEVLLGPIWGPLGFFGSFSALWGLFRTILGHSGHVWDHFWSFEVILGPFLGFFWGHYRVVSGPFGHFRGLYKNSGFPGWARPPKTGFGSTLI